MLKITIKAPDLAGLVGRELLDVQRVGLAAAGGVRRCVSAHLRGRGGLKFWRAASERVEVEPTAEGADVAIYQRGVALRYYGGTVRPKAGHKALAIPTEKGPRDTWPYEMPGLVFRRVSRKWPHLVRLLVHKDKPEEPLYRLVNETQHKADPGVMPTEEQMMKAAVGGVTRDR